MTWSRRELLTGLGVSAASTLLATLGCGGARSVRRKSIPVAAGTDVRDWLRAAVEQLRGEFPRASAHAVVARRVTAALDLRGRGVLRGQRAAVVLRVEDGSGRVLERATGELSADAVSGLVGTLRRGTGPGRGLELGALRRDGPVGGSAGTRDDAAWLALVDAIAQRGEAVSTSRVVYHGAWIDTDDVTIWHVGAGATEPGIEREQQLVRSRAGLVLVSWNGSIPMVGQVERGAVGGPDRVVLSDADIRAAARGALELTTPGTVPAGPATVVLMPSVVARLAEVGIAPMMTTGAWSRADLAARSRGGQPIGASSISVRSDPDPARYGGYHFDDEGVAAPAVPLIEAGVLRAPIGDRRGAATIAGAVGGGGLRPGHTGPVAAAIGHLAWSHGNVAIDDLPDALDEAWQVEDAGAGHADPAAWTVTIQCGRARRVKSGAFTGHLHADIELTAEVPALLAAVTQASTELETFVVRDGSAADARWRSIEVPALVTRATIAPRRPG